MGAWGIKTFENDDSSDWLYDLEESNDLSVIESTLEQLDEEYIESPEGCNLLAAAEIMLALQGKARIGLPDNASEWVAKNISLDPSHLNEKFKEALSLILSEKSELNELWEETEDYSQWLSDVNDIKTKFADI